MALFAGLAVVAVTLATVAISYNTGPVETFGMGAPILAETVPVEGYMRQGPEYLSPLPQMQMLTCFGTCGAACQVISKPCELVWHWRNVGCHFLRC